MSHTYVATDSEDRWSLEPNLSENAEADMREQTYMLPTFYSYNQIHLRTNKYVRWQDNGNSVNTALFYLVNSVWIDNLSY